MARDLPRRINPDVLAAYMPRQVPGFQDPYGAERLRLVAGAASSG